MTTKIFVLQVLLLSLLFFFGFASANYVSFSAPDANEDYGPALNCPDWPTPNPNLHNLKAKRISIEIHQKTFEDGIGLNLAGVYNIINVKHYSSIVGGWAYFYKNDQLFINIDGQEAYNYYGGDWENSASTPQINFYDLIATRYPTGNPETVSMTFGVYDHYRHQQDANGRIDFCVYASCDADDDGILAVACGGTDANDDPTNDDSIAPVITGISTVPQMPFVNNGTLQDIKVFFNSSEFLINVRFVLYNQSGEVEMQDKGLFNSAGDLPVIYTVPADLAEGNYSLELVAIDAAGNFGGYHIGNFTVHREGILEPDTSPPAPVTNLRALGRGECYILWGWDNPSDADFAYSLVYLDGLNVENTSANTYNATGLQANISYTLAVYSVDDSGNVNTSGMSDTQRTLPHPDTTDSTPPGRVENLMARGIGQNFIFWAWNNPSDSDFALTLVYLNGQNVANVSVGEYNATNLQPGMEYNITLYTQDASGNVNTWGLGDIRRTLTIPDADEDEDEDDRRNGRRNVNYLTGFEDEFYEYENAPQYDFGDLEDFDETPAKKTKSLGEVMGWIVVGLFILSILLALLLIVLAYSIKK